mgnify:CR=1 FL=1
MDARIIEQAREAEKRLKRLKMAKYSTDLFDEIIEEMMRIERALVVNPPQERGGKEINLTTLQKETRLVEKGLEDRGVISGEAELAKQIRALPLYRDASEDGLQPD